MRLSLLQRNIHRYTALEQRLHRLDRRFSSVRLGVFGLIILSMIADGFTNTVWQGAISLGLVVGFVWVWTHHRYLQGRHRAVGTYLTHYRAQLARATHDWGNLPPSPYPGSQPRPALTSPSPTTTPPFPLPK